MEKKHSDIGEILLYVPVVQNFPATSGVTSKFPERIKLGFSWKYFRLGELTYRKLTEGGLATGK